MSVQGTSFKKKTTSKVPFIPGSRPSIQNAQLLISSGVPSFDYVIGGGIPVGTLVFVQEDKYGIYSKVFAKYFIAEGIVSGHSVFIASQDLNCEKLVKDLPSPINYEESYSSSISSGEQMTIAWRYQNMRIVDSSPTSTAFGHHFVLTKTMDKETLKDSDICYWSGIDDCTNTKGCFSNPAYYDLLNKIQQTIKKGQFGVDSNSEKKNLLRIAVLSLGSPLWINEISTSHQQSDLSVFCYCLRSLLRNSYAVCMLTIPSHLFQEVSSIRRCEHLSDTCIKLESFAGSEKETNPIYKDYHGLFHINKLSAINSLTPHVPESFDLAFKLRRKKFVIEKLHLPPELQETQQREQDDIPSIHPKVLGCSGGGKSNLDF